MAAVEEKLEFSHCYLPETYCMSDGLKSLLGTRIRIWLGQDLFGQFRILEIAMAVRGMIFSASDKIRFRVGGKSANLRTSV
jgi:hypothetical protein